MVDILQQKKEELASEYIADFKKELGFFKGSIISIFAGRLKKLMTSSESLGEDITGVKLNFREKMLVNISPTTAEKVFLFVKEKQEKLQTAKTIEELEILKTGIIPPLSTSDVDEIGTPDASQQSSDEMVGGVLPDEAMTEQDQIKQTEKEYTDKAQQEKEQQEKNKTINTLTGVGVGGGFGLTVWATDKIYRLQESKKIANNIDLKTPEQFALKMKNQFESLSQQIAREAQFNPKLNKFQSQALSKSAKEFEKIAKNMDAGTIDAVAMLSKMERKLPASLLKSIDPKDAELFIKLGAKDLDEIIAINKLTTLDDAAKSLEIEKILKAKGIKSINKEVINSLKLADDVAELKGMVKVFTKLKGINGFMKGIKGVALLDLMSTGFDVRILLEGLDDAELYRKANAMRADTKREHQWVQFSTSLAITALGIIGTCAAAGSVVPGLGTAVGLVAGGLGFVASQAIDIYYNKVEFFMQNQADFQKQYRTEIKQAILQSAGAETFTMNESTRKKAAREKGAEITTTIDARKTLIRQEEYQKSDYPLVQQLHYSDMTEDEFMETLTAEETKTYQEQKAAIAKVIDKRFAYIQPYTKKGTKQYQEFSAAMTNSMGIKKIEKILADSQTYYDMQSTSPEQYVTGCTDIHEYQKKFGEKLKSEDAKLFDIGEKMWKENPYQFLEIYHGVKSFEAIFDNQKEQQPDKTQIDTVQKNMNFIKRFYEYKMIGLPLEEEQRLSLSVREIDNNKIEKMLISSNFDMVNSYNQDNVKWYFTNNGITDRMQSKMEIAESVGQNIIYRIATEIHGYTGSNDMQELIQFFSVGKENATGLYYDNKKWIINNDRAVDKSIDISEFDTMGAEDIIQKITKPNRKNRILAAAVPSPLGPVGVILGATGVYNMYGFTDDASSIDTATESMDDQLNAEYMTRLKAIIYQEKALAMQETKKIVEQKIIDYITKNTKDGEYIELPYYLIIAAKKSKIGDLQKFLFTKKNNQIVACTNKLYITEKLDFGQTKTTITKEYISLSNENLPPNAQKYIDYVDTAKQQFEALITYEGNELDLPKEFLQMYKQKIIERDTVKQSLSAMDPAFATSQLEAQYQEYHDYFENNYIALLSLISSFGSTIFSSNDVDVVAHQQQIATITAALSNIASGPEGVTEMLNTLTEKQRKLYNEILQKNNLGKQIAQDMAGTDTEKKNKAIWQIRQIIKSIVENEILIFGKQGDIEGISFGESDFLVRESSYKKGLDILLAKNLATSKYLDTSQFSGEVSMLDNDKITIKSLTSGQEQLTSQTKKIQQAIESTQPDSVYPGRGLVTFDPDTSELMSYGKATKLQIVSEKTIETKGFAFLGEQQKTIQRTVISVKVEGLDLTLSLQEGIYAANLLNRIQGKYLKNNPDFANRFFFGSASGALYAEDGLNDIDVLSSGAIEKNYAWLQNKDNQKKFLARINSMK